MTVEDSRREDLLAAIAEYFHDVEEETQEEELLRREDVLVILSELRRNVERAVRDR